MTPLGPSRTPTPWPLILYTVTRPRHVPILKAQARPQPRPWLVQNPYCQRPCSLSVQTAMTYQIIAWFQLCPNHPVLRVRSPTVLDQGAKASSNSCTNTCHLPRTQHLHLPRPLPPPIKSTGLKALASCWHRVQIVDAVVAEVQAAGALHAMPRGSINDVLRNLVLTRSSHSTPAHGTPAHVFRLHPDRQHGPALQNPSPVAGAWACRCHPSPV